MAIKLHWCKNNTLLYVRYLERVTGADLVNLALDISGNQHFDKLRYVLSDWRNCTESQIEVEDIERLAAVTEAMSRTNGNVALATLCRDEESRKAMAAFYNVLLEEQAWQGNYFVSLEETIAWMGLTASELPSDEDSTMELSYAS